MGETTEEDGGVMAYLVQVWHPETGSSTSISGKTREQALQRTIDWLGGELRWVEEYDADLDAAYRIPRTEAL